MSKKKDPPTVADMLRNPDRYAAELKSLAMGGFVSPLDAFSEEHRKAVESWPDSALDALTPGDAAMILASQISAGQRAKARKPRPAKKPTLKSVTIVEMANARRDGRTLDGFLDAAEVGSVEGLNITRTTTHGVARFDIDADAVVEAENPKLKRKSLRTMEDWWAEAGRTITTD